MSSNSKLPSPSQYDNILRAWDIISELYPGESHDMFRVYLGFIDGEDVKDIISDSPLSTEETKEFIVRLVSHHLICEL